ncbi:peptidylprolyl isomerase [uncultured Sphingomonas sp.]|uniref:peptidylprolyl isomerase n=1 Tax=uncultured Sphingomonas sp. TaxID=158754 RepID=UPI0035CAED36
MRVRLIPLFALLLAVAPVPKDVIRVRLVTSAGPIVLALDARHAPLTTANFLAYVDDGRFEGTYFYRASRRKAQPTLGLIEGGVGMDARRKLAPVKLEPTDRTGLHHLNGTVSMAHGPDPDSANGNFSIMVGDTPSLDAHRTDRGFAAFGRVVSGMDVVRRILALPSGGGGDVMRGEIILKPVTILRAERLDGTSHPTGHVKPWLLGLPSS